MSEPIPDLIDKSKFKRGMNGWLLIPGFRKYHFFWGDSPSIPVGRSMCRYWWIDRRFGPYFPPPEQCCKSCRDKLFNYVERGIIPRNLGIGN